MAPVAQVAAASATIGKLLEECGKYAESARSRYAHFACVFLHKVRLFCTMGWLNSCISCIRPKAELRAICAKDFEEARKSVAPTVDADSHTIAELEQWNAQYGEGSKSSALYNSKLSYFI